MVMKIVSSVLLALFLAALGAGAVFYQKKYQPMAAEYEKMKSGMIELDRAKTELKKYKERERGETAWLNPAIDILSAGLADAVKGGKAEVLSAGGRVVVNIAEDALYMPGSYTFAKESKQLLLKLESLLKSNELKGRGIMIGNTTEAVPAQGKGRKKIPAKEARALAANRSEALIKHLEKNGVDQDVLIAAAYSSKRPETGFTLKSRKTVIIIENPPVGPAVASKQGAPPAAPAAPSKTIPIQPAQPKTQ
jgi:flagellar motor protein MotB